MAKMVALNIRFSEETLKQIEAMANKKKRHKTEFVRLIVEDYLEKVNL